MDEEIKKYLQSMDFNEEEIMKENMIKMYKKDPFIKQAMKLLFTPIANETLLMKKKWFCGVMGISLSAFARKMGFFITYELIKYDRENIKIINIGTWWDLISVFKKEEEEKDEKDDMVFQQQDKKEKVIDGKKDAERRTNNGKNRKENIGITEAERENK